MGEKEKTIEEMNWEIFDSGKYRIHSSRIKRVKHYYDWEWLDTFLKFMFGQLIWVIPVCIWGLVANDGLKTDLIILFIYLFLVVVLAIRADIVSEGMALTMMVLKYYPHNRNALKNTINYADYIIPRLKECEKQTNSQKEAELYNQLIADMDRKVGRGNHIIGPPYDKRREEEKERKRQQEEYKKQEKEYERKQEEWKKGVIAEAEKQATEDMVYFVSKMVNGLNSLARAIQTNSPDLDKIFAGYIKTIYYYSTPADTRFKQKSSYWYEAYEAISRPIVGDKWEWARYGKRYGLGSMYFLRAYTMYQTKNYCTAKDYYSRPNKRIASVEGVMTYDFVQKFDNWFKKAKVKYTDIDQEEYEKLLERAKKLNNNDYSMDYILSKYFNQISIEDRYKQMIKDITGFDMNGRWWVGTDYRPGYALERRLESEREYRERREAEAKKRNVKKKR